VDTAVRLYLTLPPFSVLSNPLRDRHPAFRRHPLLELFVAIREKEGRGVSPQYYIRARELELELEPVM